MFAGQKKKLKMMLLLPSEGIDLSDMLKEIENGYINQALCRTHGNITKAAKLLGLQRTTLQMKLKKRLGDTTLSDAFNYLERRYL